MSISKLLISRRIRTIISRTATLLTLVGLFGLAGVVPAQPAQAAVGVNSSFNYQGRLLNAAGAVVADGTYNMQFKLYQDGAGTAAGDPGGTLMWTESWVYGVNTPDNRVTVKNGYFSIPLGTICAFTSTTCTASTGNGQTNTVVDFNQDTLWLSTNIGNTTTAATFAGASGDGEMLPMRRLASAVYALQAKTCTTCMLQAPTSTAQNTITPTVNSVVGLTVNGTSGTAATAINVVQTGQASNITTSNTGATSSSLLSVSQSTSAYTGTALLVNVANGSGTFASGAFLDLQANGASKFKIDNLGAVTGVSTITGTTLNGTTGINTGAVAGTQRIDASGNLVNISSLAVGAAMGSTTSSVLKVNAGSLGSTVGNELAVASFGYISASASSLTVRAYRASAGADWTTANLVLGMDVDNTVRASSSYLTLGANGNTGISTLTPGQKLDVQGGNINTSGLLMTGGTQRIDASGNLSNIGTITSGLINGQTISSTANFTGTVVAATSFSAPILVSTVSTGTAPLTVASTTVVTNLNADLLDGLSSASFAAATGGTGYIQNQTASPQAAGFNINGNGTLGGSLTVGGTFAQSGGYAYLGSYNSSAVYPTAGTALATAWNFTGGGRDISLWNTDIANAGSSFIFRQLTGASTRTDLLTIGASGNLTVTGAVTGGTYNGQTISSTANFTGTVAVATSLTTPILQSAAATALLVDSGTTGALNIGTNANAKTITIGNVTGATSVVINAGTGAVNIGANAIAHTTTVGTTTGAASTVIQAGSGGISLTSVSTAVTGNLTVAASKYVELTGGNTASRPGSPTAGMLYYDTTTNQLLQYNGTKWVADRTTSSKIVAASNSTQANKDAADYVATGTGDQATINTALTAAAGGSVYLMEGTYNIATPGISVPNNTTLAGAGAGSLITIPNAQNGSYDLISNQDTSTGTHVTIRDLRIDGNKAGQSSGAMSGITLTGMGGGSGSTARDGAKVTNVVVRSIYGANASGIWLNTSSNNTIIGNTIVATDIAIAVDNSSNNNTVTGNTTQGGNYGIYLNVNSNNTITGNFTQGNNYGIFLDTTSNNNTITGNTAQGNSIYGIALVLASAGNTITGNTTQGNSTGIYLSAATNNSITGNTVTGNITNGISFAAAANNNTVGSNKVHDNGGATVNNGIFLDASDSNSITGNDITDTSCTANCYAINIFNSTSDTNYLADNRFSATGTPTINDAGTGTVYANQSTGANGTKLVTRTANDAAAFQVQNAAGNGVLNVDTSSNAVVLGKASTLTGQLSFANSGNANAVTLQAGASSAAYALTLPTVAPTTSQCLLSGAVTPGLLAFGACGGGGGAATSLNNLAAVAINTSLLPGVTNSIDVGSATFSFRSSYFATSALTPLLDTATGVALNVGTNNATVINLNKNVVVAASQYLKLTGGNTASRPGSPTDGMLYFDTTTKQLLQYNSTKADWVSDHSTSTKIVAASNSTQANKDAADYIAGATSAQTIINTALTAATGGSVYLMEGTYNLSAIITIPTNTTLAGAGGGTLITIPNTQNGTYNFITNAASATHITIRDLQIDGNKANNTGTYHGIYLNAMGSGTGAGAVNGATVNNVIVRNMQGGSGIYLNASRNNTITGNKLVGNDGNGIYLAAASSSNIVTNNSAQGNVATGITVTASLYNTVTGNNAQYNTGDGIAITAVANTNAISGNHVSVNGGHGINNDSSDYNTITGNALDANVGDGIHLSGTTPDNNSVTGNSISNGNNGGVYLNGGSNNTITGNIVKHNGYHSIWLLSATYNTISSNQVNDSGGAAANDGIYLQSSTYNSISNNNLSDTDGCTLTTDCNAIYMDAGSTNNNLGGNYFHATTGGPAIFKDLGSNNSYVSQMLADGGGQITNRTVNSTANFQLQNAAGANFIGFNGTSSILNLGLNGAAGAVTNTINIATNSTPGGTNTVVIGNSAATASTVTINGGTAAAGATTINGSVLVKSLSGNSATAFQIQNNSSNSILGVDTSAGQVLFGKSATLAGKLVVYGATSGSVSITAQATTGTPYTIALPNAAPTVNQCLKGGASTATDLAWASCGGGATRTVTLVPEYAGGTMHADGTNNNGTMTSDYDTTNRHNYYSWISTVTSLNDYDVIARTQIPSEYTASLGSFKIWTYGDSNVTTNNDIKVTVIDNAGTSCSSAVSVLPGTAATWTQQTVTLSGCTFAAGGMLTIDVQVLSKSSNSVRIGEISYTYTN